MTSLDDASAQKILDTTASMLILDSPKPQNTSHVDMYKNSLLAEKAKSQQGNRVVTTRVSKAGKNYSMFYWGDRAKRQEACVFLWDNL